MTKKLTKNQQAVLQILLNQKIDEAKQLIIKEEDKELKKIKTNPPETIKKMFNEYQKLHKKFRKIINKAAKIEQALEERQWYIINFESKPILTTDNRNPLMKKFTEKKQEKITKLEKIKEEIQSKIALLDDNIDIVKYLEMIDSKIRDIIK